MRVLSVVALLVASAASEGLQSGDDCTTSLACPDSQFCQQFDDKPDNGICSLCASCHKDIDAFDGLCMEKCGMSEQPETDCQTSDSCGPLHFCMYIEETKKGQCEHCSDCHGDEDAKDKACSEKCKDVEKSDPNDSDPQTGSEPEPEKPNPEGDHGNEIPCTAHSDCPVGKVRGSVPEFCILVDHIPGTPSVCVSCAECQFDADASDGKCPPRCDGIPKTKADL
jgi:hypothetical protein